MKIILDFDDTIFNTHKLMRDVCAVFESLGFQEEQFWDAYVECKEKAGDFNPEIIIDLLDKIKPLNKIRTSSLPPRCSLSAEDCSELRVFSSQSSAERLRRGDKIKLFSKTEIEKKINSILDNSKNFVYPDFFDFARSFNKKDLILLSFGEINFQGTKIENSGIGSFFSEVIITQKNKTEDLKPICEKYLEEKIFFIDDKAEQIDEIKKIFPQIILMKMERTRGGHINMKSELADYVVKDLNEVKNIIRVC